MQKDEPGDVKLPVMLKIITAKLKSATTPKPVQEKFSENAEDLGSLPCMKFDE